MHIEITYEGVTYKSPVTDEVDYRVAGEDFL